MWPAARKLPVLGSTTNRRHTPSPRHPLPEGGTAADAKRIKDLENKEKAVTKKLAAAEKKLAEQAEKLAEAGSEDELQDAEEGGDDTDDGDCKQWQIEYDELKAGNKDLRKKINSSKSASMSKRWEQTITEHTARMEELQTKLW